MNATITRSSYDAVARFRELYRSEMACQIVHDSLHRRDGWVEWYSLSVNDAIAGYSAVVVGGPWHGTRTLFEFYVMPANRSDAFDLFSELLSIAKPSDVMVQTNDTLLSLMFCAFCHDIQSETIVFHDCVKTSLPSGGSALRRVGLGDQNHVFEHTCEPIGDWGLWIGDEVVATGGFLCHYNIPYGDIYMEVRPDKRRQGYGSFLVQELKRLAYEHGKIPCARCDIKNHPSRRTIMRAGMTPCAHILNGKVNTPGSI